MLFTAVAILVCNNSVGKNRRRNPINPNAEIVSIRVCRNCNICNFIILGIEVFTTRQTIFVSNRSRTCTCCRHFRLPTAEIVFVRLRIRRRIGVWVGIRFNFLGNGKDYACNIILTVGKRILCGKTMLSDSQWLSVVQFVVQLEHALVGNLSITPVCISQMHGHFVHVDTVTLFQTRKH